MKQLIVPIAIIVALIAIFVIIDRKEFSRHDDQTVQSESSTSNRKPLVSVPETKPVTETKPVAEAKPAVETKPVAENKPVTKAKPVTESKPKTDMKPAETKPVVETNQSRRSPLKQSPVETTTEIKPVDTRPVAQTKPEEKLLPVAVPVVTEEEAEKQNEDAMAYVLAEREKREPFYNFYRDTELKTVFFQGTVRAASIISDPEKNDYDNCLYALFVELDSILSDTSTETPIPYEVIVNVPIIKDKKILQDNIFLPGDMIWCASAEYDAMPQDIQEIQLSDDIQSFEHQQYYSITIHKIATFQNGGNHNFAKREITILPLQIMPKEEKAVLARRERIQSEIQRIEEELKKHGGTFESWKEEYKPIIEKYKKLSSEEYKVWINDSYYACGEGDPPYNTKEYIEGLQPYKKYLEDNNVDLIIVRIPNKWEFARCVLASDDFQDNPAWVEHYYECLKNDIEILDPMPAMWEHRFDYPLFYFYNDSSEMHPFEGQAIISAEVLSNILKRYSFSLSEQPIELEDYCFSTADTRYFWPEGNSKFNPKDNLSFKRVVKGNKSIGALAVNTGSPFLFLSNSFFWYPRRDEGASLPAYTAYYLQHIPDWFYQSGIGNPMLRNLIANQQALSNRKAVIMVGHPKNWKGSFFSFPKYLQDNAKKISLEKTLLFSPPDITIPDDNSFLFSKEDNGVISFVQNPEKKEGNTTFSIELSIPNQPNKSTCMLRLNFKKNSYVTMSVFDYESKKRIDKTTLSPGVNLHTDFFIPSLSTSRKVSIKFQPSYPEKVFSVKNIELWYY